MHPRNSFELNEIFETNIIKIPLKRFYGICYGGKMGEELIPSPFSGCQICSVFFTVVHHLTIFDALIQRLEKVLKFFQKLQ